jgi:hypothetical protein
MAAADGQSHLPQQSQPTLCTQQKTPTSCHRVVVDTINSKSILAQWVISSRVPAKVLGLDKESGKEVYCAKV